MKLNGTWTALVTPFTPDLSVDWDGLKKNVEFQISEGITGVLPVGTTGESPTLVWDEHNEVVEQGQMRSDRGHREQFHCRGD